MASRAGPGALILAATALLFAWWVGARGLDFGRHWDEPRLLEAMRNAAMQGTLLPGWYNYPSLSFDLVLGVASIEALGRGITRGEIPTRDVWRDGVAGRAESPAFLLRLRGVFMSLTLLTAIWAGLLVWQIARQPWVAALASLLVTFSWEVGYHARWVAPDGLVMQWGILTILLVLVSRRAARPTVWLALASAAAALTFSSKYPGGLAFVPVLARAALGGRDGRPRRPVAAMAGVVAIFLLVAAAATPGFLLDPAAVIRDVKYERHHYGVLGHYGHTTLGWGDHLALLLNYFATAALSPWRAAAIPLAVAAVAGAMVLLRRSVPDGVLLLFVPLSLVLYLSLQRAMIVRNVLPVIPFLAICAAIGCGAAVGWLRRRSRTAASLTSMAVAAAVIANAGWAWHAAQTIRLRGERDEAAQFRTLLAIDGRAFALSRRVAATLDGAHSDGAAEGEHWLALVNAECDWSRWPANRVRYQLLPAGPFEVNWDYYPGWWGDRRIVLVPPAALEWPDFRDCPAVRETAR